MKKVIVYIAMSLDGYIADKNGSVDWLGGDSSDEENLGSYGEFIEKIDTVVLGYKTYEQITTQLAVDNWPYKGLQSYIVTHRELENEPEITFTSEDLKTLIKRLKSEDGEKGIWICGGGSIITQLIEMELVDEYCISVIPTILGEGTPLFKSKIREQKLKLVSTRSYNGIVDLCYTRRES